MSNKPVKEEQQDWVGEVAKDSQALANLQSQYNDERDLVNQMLGQAQMAESFAKFALTVSTSKLAYVKENKLYRAIKGKKSADGQQFTGTWEEFCSLLNRSRQQVDEDIANLSFLGEEALESMSRMGIGYRELRQYRKLSDDQKTALIEVAKAGDKESFVELAEEIMVKHSREKESLNKQVATLKSENESYQRITAEKDQKLNEQHAELIRRTTPSADIYLEERQEKERNALSLLHDTSNIAIAAVQKFHREILSISEFSDIGIVGEEINNAIHYVYQRIAQVSVELGIQVDFQEIVNPSWAQPLVQDD